jgi:hypothetical protein
MKVQVYIIGCRCDWNQSRGIVEDLVVQKKELVQQSVVELNDK